MKKALLSGLLGLLLLSGCATAAPTVEPGLISSPVPAVLSPTEVVPTQTTQPGATPLPEPATKPKSFLDGLGREVVLPQVPQKIVSLAPSNTELLYAVGAGAQLAGRDSFSDFPAEVLDVPEIGGGFGELNMELIVSLTPDLVLASELSPPEQISNLEDLGLTVYYLPNPENMEGLFDNLILVGQLTGHEAKASALADMLRGRVAEVEEKISQVDERPLVFYELDGTDPANVWTPGGGTFIDTLITMAGGNNLGGTLESEWAQISLEALITEDPDIILLGDSTWGGVTVDAVRARTGWENLSAVSQDRVFPFDDNLVSRPGPRMVDGLEALAMLFHGELFE